MPPLTQIKFFGFLDLHHSRSKGLECKLPPIIIGIQTLRLKLASRIVLVDSITTSTSELSWLMLHLQTDLNILTNIPWPRWCL